VPSNIDRQRSSLYFLSFLYTVLCRSLRHTSIFASKKASYLYILLWCLSRKYQFTLHYKTIVYLWLKFHKVLEGQRKRLQKIMANKERNVHMTAGSQALLESTSIFLILLHDDMIQCLITTSAGLYYSIKIMTVWF